MQYKTATFDGKRICYTETTEFLVQTGHKNQKYTTRYAFKGNLHQAVRYYCGINIGRGHKKRLLMPGARKPVLARAFS
jgi:hypothetical protein